MAQDQTSEQQRERATFAGGCFWCMQAAFDSFPGVIVATVGYIGGKIENPTYEQVTSGESGHVEAIQVAFDPKVTSYSAVLNEFWQNIDPTQADGQFADRGPQYRTAIFYHDEKQKELALESKRALEVSQKFDKPIVTTIEPAGTFYTAEEYHQHYHEKNPVHYQMYKYGSGRAGFIRRQWGK